ncbi:PIG-L family deacetylase [Blautia obeum]|uniref:PIG-L family deacetylase n=1 Tax=Blautia obeum TaxID=40520 RepID=UPI0034A4506B
MKKSLFVTLIICVLLAVSALSVQAAGKTGWVRKGTTYKYKVNNTYVKDEVKKIKKYYYYFDKKGVRKTGWVKYKKDRYYFDRKTARAYTGKKAVNDKLYIFGKDGRLVKKKGLYKYGKTQVYINKNGSLATGLVKIKGKWYWFENNGVLSRKSGVHKWKNNTYYLNKGQFVTGWATVGSNKYYFGADGKMATNKYIQTSGQTYYVDASGRMKKNCWYNGQYFNNKGQLEKNATKYDSETTEGQVTKEMLDELPLSNCTKLMVVAHPDDETLWGGAHLTEGGWFVVCLTNGYNEVRKNEFYEVIKEFGCEGMILSYPDLLANGQRSTWTTECTSIAKDLNTVLKYKHWGMVATHNPNGEYGHIQHKMTSKLVTEEFYKTYWGTNLYYFGNWYSARRLPIMEDSLRKVPEAALEKKLEALKLYTSQKGAVASNIHMAEYENWIRATDW